MSSLLDDSLVGCMLVAGFGYAAYALGPRAWRSVWVRALAWTLRRAPKWLGLNAMAARLEAVGATPAGSCGGCASCGSAAAPTNRPRAAATPEVSVPVSSIRNRG